MKLSELMRSAATTDPDEARQVIAEFQEYIERNQFGLIKIGGSPLQREVRKLLRRLASVSEMLEVVEETGEPLDET